MLTYLFVYSMFTYIYTMQLQKYNKIQNVKHLINAHPKRYPTNICLTLKYFYPIPSYFWSKYMTNNYENYPPIPIFNISVRFIYLIPSPPQFWSLYLTNNVSESYPPLPFLKIKWTQNLLPHKDPYYVLQKWVEFLSRLWKP